MFPVKADKKPLTPHGLKDATQTRVGVKEYWTCWPNAGIGLVTDGLMVLDFDAKSGGLESKAAMETKHGLLSQTRTHRTGGGGEHWIYRNPDGADVRSTVAFAGYQGVDLRANGGYIVMPPSSHQSGRRYEVLDNRDIALAPTWLVILATKKKAESRQNASESQFIPEGQRNARLTSFAGTMRRRGMMQEAIEAALLEVNQQQCSPPLPNDEVIRIARSVIRYEPEYSSIQAETAVASHFNFTDLGNAERLVSRYGDILHYCYERKRWLVWNGKVWEWDAGNKVASLAKLAVRNIYHEAGFESLMDLERRIDDSGYLEAVLGLLRLEEEKGISCTEALDACEKLLKQKAKLERETSDLKKRSDSLVAEIKNANTEYDQTQKAVAKSRQELTQIRSEHVAAKKELEAFKQKMEKEKQHISREVEDSYQESNVTKEDVVAAGRIKAEVKSHGYTLDLTLGLAKEFAGYKNAREKLAEGLKEHGSLYKYLYDLHDGATKERERIISEIRGIESQKKALTAESGNMRNILSQLQAKVAYEEDLRRFHRRYSRYSGLMDNLATWDQIHFTRCGNLANRIAGFFDRTKDNHHLWTDKPPTSCPHCGCQVLYFDTEIYQYLDWPGERPYKLNLGE